MSDVQGGDVAAIPEDELQVFMGGVGQYVNECVCRSSVSIGKALGAMREGSEAKPELLQTKTYKQLEELHEALSNLVDQTEPVITTRL